MAVGVGAGFDLSGLEKSIQNAEKKLDGFVKKSEDVSKVVTKNFQDIAKNGVGSLISAISDAQKAMSKLGGSGSKNNPMKSVNESVVQAVKHTTQFMDLMAKINNDGASGRRSSAVTKINEDIESAKKRLEELQKLLNFYTKGEGKKAVGFTDTTAIQQEAKSLMFRLDALEREKASLQANERLRLSLAQRQEERDNRWIKMSEERVKRIKRESKESSDAAKINSQSIAQQRESQQRMYEKLFEKAIGREYEKIWGNAEEMLKKQQQAEKNRYEMWLAQKHKEAKEHTRIEEEKIKATQNAIAKQNAEYAKAEALRNAQAKTNQQTKDNSARIKSERDAMYKMYEQMFDDIAKKNGQTAEQIIKKNQEELRQRKKYIDEMTSMYARMFDEIAKKESQNRASKYGRIQSTGDTTSQALAAYNRLYSDKGVKSINNMNAALQRLRDAQSKLNLNTEEGRNKYNKLGEAIKRVEKDMAKLSQQSENVNKKHSQLLNISEQLQRRLALVFSVSQITGYINKIIQVRGEFELQQKALQAIVQNTDKANELWVQTVELAVKSPFRVKELVTYTKQLAAYRVESDKLYDTTKRLADVSAGLGVDMQRLILAYGQVKAANYLRGTELRQFSEAGINMLGELSKYFSEIENRAVSVADVFDRISKRGVSFGDVEAVFQRITSAGGVFYDMQEKQAETLKGQISNLNDSIDIMMNKIGKSYDGVLKGTVSILRSMVENWETIAAVAVPLLETLIVKWGVYKATMKYTQLVQSGFFSNMTTNLRASIVYLTQGTKALNQYAAANQIATTSVKAGVWGIVIGAAVAAISSFSTTLREHKRALDDITKKYDELVNKIANVSVSFKNAANSNDIKKQRTELEKLVEIANTDYHMKIKVDLEGLKDEELKGKFDEIEQTILELNAFSSSFSKRFQESTEWVGTDDIREDFNQLRTAYSDLSNEIINKKQLVLAALLPIKDTLNETQQAALNELNASKREGETQLEYVDRLKKAYQVLLDENEDIYKRIRGNHEIGTKSWREAEKNANKFLQYTQKASLDKDFWSPLFKSFSTNTQEAKEEFKDFIQTIDDDIVGLTDEQAELKLKVAIDKLAADEEWNDFLKTTVKRWTEEYYAELGVKVNLIDKENQTKNELLAWQDSYNKLFGDNILTPNVDERLTGFKEITDSATKQKDVVERLQAEWGSYNDIIKKIEAIGIEKATGKGGAYEGVDYKQMLKDRADVEKQLDYFGEEYEKNKKKDNEALQRLKEQIRLVRELAKDYQKLWDEQGKDIADASIWSKERIAAFRKAGLDYTKFEVGSEGDEVKNLEKLTDISGELYKAIADARTELGSFKQQLKDAEFARYLDELFGNYEVSLELEKLNIPPDLAKRLFGVESIDLNSIRKEILSKAGLGDMQGMTNKEIFSSERYLKLNKEQRKIVEDGLKKEDELQQKALEERLKRYSQFLVKGQSERVRIKIEELRELAKLEEDYQSGKTNMDENQYKITKEGIKKEAEDKIAKISFEEFQDSSLYTSLFSDIQSIGTKSIDIVIEHLYKMRDAMKDVPPEIMDKLQSRIDELEKLRIERNPFKGLEDAEKTIQNVSKIKETYKNEKGEDVTVEGEDALTYRLIKGEDELKQLNDKLVLLEQIKQANGDINLLIDAGIPTSEENLILLGRTEEINNQILKTNNEISKKKNDISGISIQINNYQKAKQQIIATAEAWADVVENTKKAAESTKEIFISLGAEADSTAMDIVDIGTSFLDATAQLILFSVQMKMMQAQAAALGITVNAALGPIGWIASALSAASMIAQSFFGASDKAKEREIQSQIKLVDKLGKQYEKLEKQIDEAYSIDQLKGGMDAAKSNMEQQLAAYDNMIAAEEDKKKTDKSRIEEWKEAKEELTEQYEELQKEQIESMGGTYDYKGATREFVEAWIDAFNETGNGLDGLTKHFQEWWNDILVNQAVMKQASKIMQPLLDKVNKSLEDYTIDDKEQKDVFALADTVKGDLDNYLKEFYEKFGSLFTGVDDSGLSGLQRGIQGITESQADILASYLNSIRFYVSENNSMLSQYLEYQRDNNTIENPMLTQLKSIVTQTTAINEMLDEIRKEGGNAAFNVRVIP